LANGIGSSVPKFCFLFPEHEQLKEMIPLSLSLKERELNDPILPSMGPIHQIYTII